MSAQLGDAQLVELRPILHRFFAAGQRLGDGFKGHALFCQRVQLLKLFAGPRLPVSFKPTSLVHGCRCRSNRSAISIPVFQKAPGWVRRVIAHAVRAQQGQQLNVVFRSCPFSSSFSRCWSALWLLILGAFPFLPTCASFEARRWATAAGGVQTDFSGPRLPVSFKPFGHFNSCLSESAGMGAPGDCSCSQSATGATTECCFSSGPTAKSVC